MKERVEAILFATGRFMSVEELARILNHNKTAIQESLNKLEQEIIQERRSQL